MRILYWALAVLSLSSAALPDNAKPAGTATNSKTAASKSTAKGTPPPAASASKQAAKQAAAPANKQAASKQVANKQTANKQAANKQTANKQLANKQAAPAGARSTASGTRQGTTSSATARNSRPRPVYRPMPSQPTPERYKEIQTALVQKGYLHSAEPSGAWDPETVDAMKRFQKDQNLDPDGKINSLSLIALGLGPKRTQPAASANPQPPAAPTVPNSNTNNPNPQAPPKP